MNDVDSSPESKEIKKLALIGLSILILFSVGFAAFYYYVEVLGYGGGDIFVAFMPLCLIPYLIGMSVYIGYFAAKFAKKRWKRAWLWGICGFALTVLFIIGFPILLSPLFPYQSPAIFAFLAPLLSSLLIVLLISIRRKVTV